jgi:hypothetical protein
MILRTAAVIALVIGVAGASTEALAQFIPPGPPRMVPPPFQPLPLPPAAEADGDDQLPAYDPRSTWRATVVRSVCAVALNP